MDTNTYLIYIEQYIINYRFIGSILSILGGIGILIHTSVTQKAFQETLELQETLETQEIEKEDDF